MRANADHNAGVTPDGAHATGRGGWAAAPAPVAGQVSNREGCAIGEVVKGMGT